MTSAKQHGHVTNGRYNEFWMVLTRSQDLPIVLANAMSWRLVFPQSSRLLEEWGLNLARPTGE